MSLEMNISSILNQNPIDLVIINSNEEMEIVDENKPETPKSKPYNKIKQSKEEIMKERLKCQTKKKKEQFGKLIELSKQKAEKGHEAEMKKKIAEEQRRINEQKKAEKEAEKELKKREREEKEREAEMKKKIAEEQRRINEQKKAEKEAEKELKKREREEKERIKNEEANKRKQIEEEKTRKQQLVSNKFLSFFTKISPEQKKKPKIGNLELQKCQSIASYVPEISKENFVKGAFDSNITHQDEQILYLDELKIKKRIPIKHMSRPLNKIINWLNDGDDIIVENSRNDKKIYRAKLLQFHENYRPAYFGTWRKNSKYINGRRPFCKDLDLFDYTVDSDDEWDEEEGENIKDSDSEKDNLEDEEEMNGDDYELDDVFVPHGHLSDDENQEDYFEITETPDGKKKRKLLTKEKIIIEERTKKLKTLIPKAKGCLWMQSDEFENKAKFKDFEKYKVVFVN